MRPAVVQALLRRRWPSIAALLLGAAIALVAWVWVRNHASEDGSPPPSAAATPQSVGRGAYLARAGNCAACHTARGGVEYAGGRPLQTPFGTVYAGNLTPDRDTGLGGWTRADFRRALRHGRSRDGRLLYPAFPYTSYTQVTGADADALFDYLQSLRPVRQPNRAHRLRWPYSTQAALAVWRALYFTAGEHRDDASRSPQWNRGAYLVRGLGHCGACHAARNALGATRDLMDLSGGLIPMQNWYAPSLADAAQAGVAGWPDEQVVRLLQAGVAGTATVLGPMAEVVLHSTQHLARDDLQAMAVFLKSLPPTASTPAPVAAAAPGQLQRGRQLYDDHCAQCHGTRGEGVAGAYPALDRNRAVTLAVTTNLVQVVLHGGYPPSTAGNPRPFGMPPYATLLGDADVAAVLTFIRGAWANRAPPVSELDVAQQRSSTR